MNTFTVHCFQHEEEATYLDLSGNSIGETESRFVVDLLFRNPIFTELVCQHVFMTFHPRQGPRTVLMKNCQ